MRSSFLSDPRGMGVLACVLLAGIGTLFVAAPAWTGIGAFSAAGIMAVFAMLAKRAPEASPVEVETVAPAEDNPLAPVLSAARRGKLETRVIPLPHDDALASLARDLNHLLDVTDAFVREAKGSINAVSEGRTYRRILPNGLDGDFRAAALGISEAMSRVAAKVDHFQSLTERFENEAIAVSRDVAAGATSFARTAETMNARTAKSRETAEEVLSRTEDARKRVNAAAQIAQDVRNALSTVQDSTEGARDRSRTAMARAHETRETVTALHSSAQSVTKVVEMIQNVADNIGLLSVNASIEAARAGEAGKGFAVVAGEIQALASRTSEATREINRSIGQMLDGVNLAVDTFETLGTEIEALDAHSADIARSMADQIAAIGDLTSDIASAAGSADESAKLVRTISQTIEDSGEAVRDLRDAALALRARTGDLDMQLERYLAAAKAA